MLSSTFIKPFTKDKERIKAFKETGDLRYICQNILEKACFQRDMAYGKFKYLPRRTVADEVLRDKAFNVAKNSKYDKCLIGLASTASNFFEKKSSGGAVSSEIIPNQELA